MWLESAKVQTDIPLLKKPLSKKQTDRLLIIDNEYPVFQASLTSSLGLGIMYL
jgi:hypothetical protein